MLEVEIKVHAELTKTEQRLKELGFQIESTVYEHDFYFNNPLTDLRRSDKALRIREYREKGEDPRFILNYKGPKIDSTTMTREETEFEIPDFDHGEKLLNGLGYSVAGEVEKYRNSYRKNEIVCCLDQVTGLGDFIEIEIIAADEAAYQEALKKINQVMKELGLKMEDTLRTSYLSMLENLRNNQF